MGLGFFCKRSQSALGTFLEAKEKSINQCFKISVGLKKKIKLFVL